MSAASLLKAVESFLIRRTSIDLVEEHYILTSALSATSTVVDLGANLGRFSGELAGRFGCACVALEPAPENVAKISRHPRVHVVAGAMGAKAGKGKLQMADDCTANRLTFADVGEDTGSISVDVFDYHSLLRAAGVRQVDLLKVDVEGAEWEFFDSLSDTDLRGIGQITIEFHDFIEDLGELRRTWQVYQRLLGLGFRCVEDPVHGSYNVLFVHPALEMPWGDHLLLTAITVLRRCAWKLDRVTRAIGSRLRSVIGSPDPASVG